MLFSEVTGHNRIKDVLSRAIQTERVGHAYIFEGESGIGRLSMAKAFAKRLLCESEGTEDACGVCKSCTMCQSGNHPDVQVVTNQLYDPGKKTTDILIDTIRTMKSDVYIKPYLRERKIYIIPNADTMNVYAQNSLLKVLEEPPAYCTIILIAENSNNFLPTILSRTQILRFHPLDDDEVKEWLSKNRQDVDGEEIDLASKMCMGSIGKAIELLENSEAKELREELMDCIFEMSGASRKCIYNLASLFKQNKAETEFLLDTLRTVFRDILYIKECGEKQVLVNSDKSIKLGKLSESMSKKGIIDALRIVLKYSDYFSKNISGAVYQCLGLELWEAINDRGYRSKI